MKNRLKTAKKNYKKNSGFSLIELIISVVILAVIVVPIMNSFITSTKTSAKSQKFGEATDAADNILEYLNSISVQKFMTCDESVETVLKGDTSPDLELSADPLNGTLDDNGDKIVDNLFYIDNIKSGSSNFDAKITVTPGTEEHHKGFYEINNKEMVSYIKPDGSFTQPFDDASNPDSTSENSTTYIQFTAKSGVGQFNNVQRIIDIDISENNGRAYLYITYHYLFTYSGTRTEKYCIVSRRYAMFSGGIELKEDESPIVAYFMYYPFYQETYGSSLVEKVNGREKGKIDKFTNQDVRTSDGITLNFHGNEDQIIVNNMSEVPVKLFIVKEWPAQYDETTEKYSTMPDATLAVKEATYKGTITEKHSVTYADGYNYQLYTNMAFNLVTDLKIPTMGDYYSIERSFGTEQIHGGNVTDSSNSITGQLVNVDKIDRIYYIGIELYAHGHNGEEEYKIYEMKGSALR